jgi:ribosomal protein S18 acetylase RimI-like enzyme
MDASPVLSPPAAPEKLEPGPVQPTVRRDRRAIRRIALATGVFKPVELDTVDELLDEYLRSPQKSGYNFLSYKEEGRVLGFVAWGPRDLAENGYDLYWIATHPDAQGRGVARALLGTVEAIIRARNGGWLLIETEDSPPYQPARAFYERCGYQPAAVLPDFYRDGDGLIIYAKRIG